jgi:quercetin dioxygenase-like cupin family protein
MTDDATAPGMFSHAGAHDYVDALPGIRRKTLAYGSRTILTEFRLDAGADLPVHDHPYEQTGYLVTGRLRLSIGPETRVMSPGDSWSVPGGVPHGGVAEDDSVAVEVFSPVREDYLPAPGA